LVTVALVINLSGRLLLPKLMLIWKGEKVALSRILRDHKLSSTVSKASTISSRFQSGTNTLEEEEEKRKKPRATRTSSLASVDEKAETAAAPTETGNESRFGNEEAAADYKTISWSGEVMNTSGLSLDLASEVEKPPRPLTASWTSHQSEASTGSEATALVIRPGHAPPSKICVGISMHSQLLSRINNRILSGLEVPECDWEELRTSFSEMHSIFGHNVTYEWEN
jgi:hypothetical protein